MLAKCTYKNQLTIPKQIIDKFGGVEYFDVEARQDEIVLRPVEIKRKGLELAAVREKMKKLGISEDSIDEAVRWARKKK